jgi:hypothetical protein
MTKNIDREKLEKILKVVILKNIKLDMRIIVDDTAATSVISLSHLELIKSSQIEGCSILPNGGGLETFKQGLKSIPVEKRKRVLYSIHLDICEGVPTLNSQLNLMRTDKFGNFKYSFVLFFFELFFSTKHVREKKLKFIESEWRNQISSIQKYFVGIIEFSGVDSHRHFHANPYLKKVARNLAKDFGLNLRIPKENFYLTNLREVFSMSFLVGICKLTILNLFLRKEKRDGRYFLGVLHSGNMTASKTISGILKIVSRSKDGDDVRIDVLFHPGRDIEVINDIRKNLIFREWYSSINRDRELQEIIILRNFKAKFGINSSGIL